jgi:4-alpha-glucanotransferase
MNNKRSAGVLMPVFSLYSKYGIGDFGEGAYFFIDWLKKANQSYWQILPLGQTSFGDSPYQSFSTFAGNPYFISPDELIKENLLTKKECDSFDFGEKEEYVSYEKLFDNRFKLLKIAFGRWDLSDSKYKSFLRENENWLDGYALFMAIKNYMGQKEWLKWEKDIRARNKTALEYYKNKLKEEIDFYKFIQFIFFKQWEKLKKYANSKGIQIIGDLPIYVAMDSVDVWENTKLFQIDKNFKPVAVAGCPPDDFSKEGQLWGNPLYDWEENKRDGYKWWEKRLWFL